MSYLSRKSAIKGIWLLGTVATLLGVSPGLVAATLVSIKPAGSGRSALVIDVPLPKGSAHCIAQEGLQPACGSVLQSNAKHSAVGVEEALAAAFKAGEPVTHSPSDETQATEQLDDTAKAPASMPDPDNLIVTAVKERKKGGKVIILNRTLKKDTIVCFDKDRSVSLCGKVIGGKDGRSTVGTLEEIAAKVNPGDAAYTPSDQEMQAGSGAAAQRNTFAVTEALDTKDGNFFIQLDGSLELKKEYCFYFEKINWKEYSWMGGSETKRQAFCGTITHLEGSRSWLQLPQADFAALRKGQQVALQAEEDRIVKIVRRRRTKSGQHFAHVNQAFAVKQDVCFSTNRPGNYCGTVTKVKDGESVVKIDASIYSTVKVGDPVVVAEQAAAEEKPFELYGALLINFRDSHAGDLLSEPRSSQGSGMPVLLLADNVNDYAVGKIGIRSPKGFDMVFGFDTSGYEIHETGSPSAVPEDETHKVRWKVIYLDARITDNLQLSAGSRFISPIPITVYSLNATIDYAGDIYGTWGQFYDHWVGLSSFKENVAPEGTEERKFRKNKTLLYHYRHQVSGDLSLFPFMRFSDYAEYREKDPATGQTTRYADRNHRYLIGLSSSYKASTYIFVHDSRPENYTIDTGNRITSSTLLGETVIDTPKVTHIAGFYAENMRFTGDQVTYEEGDGGEMLPDGTTKSNLLYSIGYTPFYKFNDKFQGTVGLNYFATDRNLSTANSDGYLITPAVRYTFTSDYVGTYLFASYSLGTYKNSVKLDDEGLPTKKLNTIMFGLDHLAGYGY